TLYRPLSEHCLGNPYGAILQTPLTPDTYYYNVSLYEYRQGSFTQLPPEANTVSTAGDYVAWVNPGRKVAGKGMYVLEVYDDKRKIVVKRLQLLRL
ncbi:MAG TPA: hypothetical protein VIM87_14430, partial [Chitinophaga sp.]|uniref:hypothetical protein n=1 Tax=Chitinophaga sp. TaxID=1869181 RepID=UPI002F93AA71